MDSEVRYMSMINRMYTIEELSNIKGVPEVTIRYWIWKGRLKALQKVDRFNPRRWYISEEDWLLVPTYIRNRYEKITKVKEVINALDK